MPKSLFYNDFSRLQLKIWAEKIVDAVDAVDLVDSGIIQQLQQCLKRWGLRAKPTEKAVFTACR
ncbi:hypothetical protein FACHB389_29375 [Nostoc calcicola FACHB-389]|nr:hypothetical protein [Nostoc calcicola FACHB-3891]OKH25720.1 hypothetical protein FACHB389_29375 [Nostoc calcicola FACHB-389]